MNWIDLFGDNGSIEVSFSEPNFYDLEDRCEDDTTVVAPWIDLLPAESNKEEPSPLDFDGARRFGETIVMASELTWLYI